MRRCARAREDAYAYDLQLRAARPFRLARGGATLAFPLGPAAQGSTILRDQHAGSFSPTKHRGVDQEEGRRPSRPGSESKRETAPPCRWQGCGLFGWPDSTSCVGSSVSSHVPTLVSSLGPRRIALGPGSPGQREAGSEKYTGKDECL